MLRRDPSLFAAWLHSLSLAERELWLMQFAEYAAERGIEDAVIQALGTADDPSVHALAEPFDEALAKVEAPHEVVLEEGLEPLP